MLIGVIAEETLLPLVAAPTGPVIDSDVIGALFGRPDTFFLARISVIGFLSPVLLDETAVLGAENFYPSFVTNGYQGIFPDLVGDSDTFYAPIRSAVPVLVSPLFKEFDFIYAPSLAIVAIHPTVRYIDPDIFFAPAFRQGLAPDLVVDSDVIRPTIIRLAGDAFVLQSDIFDDADIIFAASTARDIAPHLVVDNDIIYAAANANFVAPAAFSSDDFFFASFIFNQLLPSLVVDADQFIGPELRTPGRMGLVVDDDLFFVPIVKLNPLAPLLMIDVDAFPTIVIGSNPALYPILPVADIDDTFYVPAVAFGTGLAPHFWPDVDTVLAVRGVALGQAQPATFNASDTGGAIALSGGNLTVTSTASTVTAVRTNAAQISGKFYFEITWTTATGSAGQDGCGIASAAASLVGGGGTLPGNGSLGCICFVGGSIFSNGAVQSGANLGAFANGNVCCVAIDMSNKRIWFRKNNGNWNNSGTANPATNVGGIDISAVFASIAAYGAVTKNGTAPVAVGNFGNTTFAFTPPSGFIAGPS